MGGVISTTIFIIVPVLYMYVYVGTHCAITMSVQCRSC